MGFSLLLFSSASASQRVLIQRPKTGFSGQGRVGLQPGQSAAAKEFILVFLTLTLATLDHRLNDSIPESSRPTGHFRRQCFRRRAKVKDKPYACRALFSLY